MTENKIHKAMFLQLVFQYQTTAMIGMGKIKDPMTDKIERDLHSAKFSIDMLDMLKNRTKGNLDNDEEKFLDQILRDLKLNYVDEKNKKAEPQAEQASETELSDAPS
jgi:hypothetical protein